MTEEGADFDRQDEEADHTEQKADSSKTGEADKADAAKTGEADKESPLRRSRRAYNCRRAGRQRLS